jgi:hypothetical protein
MAQVAPNGIAADCELKAIPPAVAALARMLKGLLV